MDWGAFFFGWGDWKAGLDAWGAWGAWKPERLERDTGIISYQERRVIVGCRGSSVFHEPAE